MRQLPGAVRVFWFSGYTRFNSSQGRSLGYGCKQTSTFSWRGLLEWHCLNSLGLHRVCGSSRPTFKSGTALNAFCRHTFFCADHISLHCALGLAAQCIVIGSGVIKTFLSKTKTSISRPIPRPCMTKPSVQDQTLRLKIKTGTKTKAFLWCILEADWKEFFIFGRKRKCRRKWNSIYGRKRNKNENGHSFSAENENKSHLIILVFFFFLFLYIQSPSQSYNAPPILRLVSPFFAVAIDADTILKFGGQTPAQSAGIFFTVPPNLHCAPIPGAQRGHTTVEKIDIVKIKRVK